MLNCSGITTKQILKYTDKTKQNPQKYKNIKDIKDIKSGPAALAILSPGIFMSRSN